VWRGSSVTYNTPLGQQIYDFEDAENATGILYAVLRTVEQALGGLQAIRRITFTDVEFPKLVSADASLFLDAITAGLRSGESTRIEQSLDARFAPYDGIEVAFIATEGGVDRLHIRALNDHGDKAQWAEILRAPPGTWTVAAYREAEQTYPPVVLHRRKGHRYLVYDDLEFTSALKMVDAWLKSARDEIPARKINSSVEQAVFVHVIRAHGFDVESRGNKIIVESTGVLPESPESKPRAYTVAEFQLEPPKKLPATDSPLARAEFMEKFQEIIFEVRDRLATALRPTTPPEPLPKPLSALIERLMRRIGDAKVHELMGDEASEWKSVQVTVEELPRVRIDLADGERPDAHIVLRRCTRDGESCGWNVASYFESGESLIKAIEFIGDAEVTFPRLYNKQRAAVIEALEMLEGFFPPESEALMTPAGVRFESGPVTTLRLPDRDLGIRLALARVAIQDRLRLHPQEDALNDEDLETAATAIVVLSLQSRLLDYVTGNRYMVSYGDQEIEIERIVPRSRTHRKRPVVKYADGMRALRMLLHERGWTESERSDSIMIGPSARAKLKFGSSGEFVGGRRGF